MESPQIICPVCKRAVTFVPTGDGRICPRCGTTFGVGAGERLPDESSPPPQAAKTWLVLLAVLLTPAVMTFLAALSRSGEASGGIAFFGSAVGALIGAFWLVSRLNLHAGIRIGLAILLAPVFFGACLALCFAGCALGDRGGFRVGG